MTANIQTTEAMVCPPAVQEVGEELWWLITGQESLDKLRTIIIQLSQEGSTKQTYMPGPFHIMGSLSYTSLTTLVNSLPRDACLDLFRMEQNYRSRSTASGSGKNHGG